MTYEARAIGVQKYSKLPKDYVYLDIQLSTCDSKIESLRVADIAVQGKQGLPEFSVVGYGPVYDRAGDISLIGSGLVRQGHYPEVAFVN